MADLAIDLEEFKRRALANFGSGDVCHLGHIVLQSLADHPDVINQIDAATGEQETNEQVLRKSVRLAHAMRQVGLKPGDVMALSGFNHLEVSIPYFAAHYNGLPVLGVDPLFQYDEIRSILSFSKPKIIFCELNNAKNFEKAAKSLHINPKIYTFRKGESTMNAFVDEYSTEEDVKNFRAAHFDKLLMWLVSTSGSTGIPKVAAFEENVIFDTLMFYLKTWMKHRGGIYLLISPVQWLSNYLVTISSPLTRTTVLKTSATATTDHIVKMINKYKPNTGLFGPPVITQVLKHPESDLSCFDVINVGGSRVYKDLIEDLKSRTKGKIFEAYGQSECMGVLFPVPGTPVGSCGKSIPRYQLKLVDPETENEIKEPNVPGELRVKGPIFAGYFNNPEETAKAFTEDGWFKTGDILYRDENDFYYFVERLKMRIKYKNYSYHVHPTELEGVIRELPDVIDVAVTGVPDPEFGELPAACVIRRPHSELTAQRIKDFVKDRLSDAKQLRGGVVFVNELPLTSTAKVARTKLLDLVLTGHRE